MQYCQTAINSSKRKKKKKNETALGVWAVHLFPSLRSQHVPFTQEKTLQL